MEDHTNLVAGVQLYTPESDPSVTVLAMLSDNDEVAAQTICTLLSFGIPLDSISAIDLRVARRVSSLVDPKTEPLSFKDMPLKGGSSALRNIFTNETDSGFEERVISGIGPVSAYGFIADELTEPSLGEGFPVNGLALPLKEYGVPIEDADLFAQALLAGRVLVISIAPSEQMRQTVTKLIWVAGGADAPFASLVIESVGDRELAEITDFLAALEMAYNSFLFFEALSAESMRWLLMYWEFQSVLLTNKQLRERIQPANRLILKQVRLQSPGFWEFLGSLSPLEVARQYLQDRHERRKDRSFRESHEDIRLYLENCLLLTKVINERIAIGKTIGLSEQQMAPLVDDLLFKPLNTLGRYQDDGLIGEIGLTPIPLPQHGRGNSDSPSAT